MLVLETTITKRLKKRANKREKGREKEKEKDKVEERIKNGTKKRWSSANYLDPAATIGMVGPFERLQFSPFLYWLPQP
ncbi:hypothetical protein K0M31_004720 [Melipona bicolor]|uniref:Uncharacterized protein n=1 Tax=Melipona bicolor TaxID=60889 RepID=A0AA40FW38_9HYME|nr:hypothetical protein K0M31_004720 [Melipona bicolor]